MAVVGLCGFEGGHPSELGHVTGTGLSIITASPTPYSGAKALKIAPSSGSNCIFCYAVPNPTTAGLQTYRFYLQVGTLPSITSFPLVYGGVSWTTVGTPVLEISTTGHLVLVTNISSTDTVQATSTNALSADGLWHRIEYGINCVGGGGQQVWVDGVSWVSSATGSGGTVQASVLGQQSISTATPDGTMFFDDVILDTSLIGSPRSSNYKLAFMAPISDNARNADWLGGAGGTTSLFDTVNNSPPVGVASTGTNTSQIGDAVKSSTDNYDANVQSYTTAGVGASDTINNVLALCNHGASVVSTAETGAIVIVSNPSGQSEQTYTFGTDGPTTATIAGTFPTGWFTAFGPATASPSVTKGTSPVVRVGRRSANKTTNVMIDFMGMYADYTPFVPSYLPPAASGMSQAVHRAAHFFSRVPWQEKRPSGLILPDLLRV